MGEPRTKHLFYRCKQCGKGITCLQIEATWEKAEASKSISPSLCSCGSRQVSPGNPFWWEELFKPSIWKLWYKRVYKQPK